MRRSLRTLVVPAAAAALITGVMAAVGTSTTSAAPAAPPGRDRFEVYVGEMLAGQVADVVALGIDRHEIGVRPADGARGRGEVAKRKVEVEVVLSPGEVRKLEKQGIDMEPKIIEGQTVTARATALDEEGHEVFRPYAGPGGLKEEFEQVARDNPRLAKLVTVGQSTNGQDIIAVKVTKNARLMPDGKRPAVLYASAQHAREWITPEMTRRLMRDLIAGYDTDPQVRRLLDRTELWFLPVANPDGYDWTFEPGQRLWRKNLRDNDGNGIINTNDGVDLNRNFPYKWGYDNEGSSPSPSNNTYRGPGPASEPETQAFLDLTERVGFEFLLNYHSAAELLLYGTGWQVATPTPDDLIYETLAGDDAEPAVPGYDPDISAELYTTNGDTDTSITELYGTLGFTPEMSTCTAAAASVPDDEWVPEECGTGFEFPDDEELVAAEYAKNVPFALSVAQSAADPDDPVSVVGRKAPAFDVDTFTTSHGGPQEVAVVAKRALQQLALNYRVDGGPVRTARVSEWEGGERYGDENDDYYAEYRGTVPAARPGAQVEAWFTAVQEGVGRTASERFTYEVADAGADVLVVGNEDYTGVNPTYPAGTDSLKYADAHVAAVEAAGYSADVWDVDAQGIPHDLGVLSHYDAVLWYLGDNRITQDPEDVLTSTPFGNLPEVSVAERQQYLTIAMRDYLNEGGKLLHAGETAQYEGLPGISDAVGGLYYGLNGDPTAECVISTRPNPSGATDGFFEDCLILADDFRQYYLGAFSRISTGDATSVVGTESPFAGYTGTLGGPVVEGDNPLDEAGVWTPTSDVLPVEQFPQFESDGSMIYPLPEGSPFAPVEGDRYAGILHTDDTYARLSRTVDVPAGASQAELRFALSWNTEEAYDHVIVEARTAGGDDWTTLPELGGATSPAAPADCEQGFLLALHPFLGNYLGGADCTEPGATGEWHGISGDSGGWEDVAFDLSGYAGSAVELSISYVSDPASNGVGAFVDDTSVVIDGVVDADGFEGETSDWAVGTVPPGSPPPGSTWQIGETLFTSYAATSTDDSVLLGFGLEQVATEAERNELVGRALDGLID